MPDARHANNLHMPACRRRPLRIFPGSSRTRMRADPRREQREPITTRDAPWRAAQLRTLSSRAISPRQLQKCHRPAATYHRSPPYPQEVRARPVSRAISRNWLASRAHSVFRRSERIPRFARPTRKRSEDDASRRPFPAGSVPKPFLSSHPVYRCSASSGPKAK